MEEFWILILTALFATNLLDKSESVKLELKTFDEIFGEGWWDKGEAEDLKMLAPTNFGQNVHHQIDRQNTQNGQIEPNSTDQLGQIEPNSTDQNPPLTESRRKPKNERQKLVEKFDQMKAELKRAGFKNSYTNELDKTVAKELGLSFMTIYNWKRRHGQTMTNYSNNEKFEIVKKFMRMKSDHSGGKVNFANPHQTINTPTANKRN
uniref:Uncharacterized protein n=1 Tax=Globodera rostochiensis TaxID=31243 RepID=A0A914HR99_GLORO